MKYRSPIILIILLVVAASAFHMQQASAVGTYRILPDGTISPLGAPITTLDKITYTITENIVGSISIERSNILTDGAGHTVTGDGNGNGFTLVGVNNVTIRNANIHNFTYGIYAETATSILILDNNLTANTYDGIGLFYCHATTILANLIAENDYDGMEIYNCLDNNIKENCITANAWFGIALYEYSTGNVTGNVIADNYGGVELSYSSNMGIFHNNFVNNNQPVSSQFSSPIWDNGCEGNYWSDYDGTDLDGDGVGDTKLLWNGVDGYPLMSPYWISADVNHDLVVDIFDVVTTTAAYESTPLDPGWNPHADIAEPHGIIDIFDVVTCTSHYDETW